MSKKFDAEESAAAIAAKRANLSPIQEKAVKEAEAASGDPFFRHKLEEKKRMKNAEQAGVDAISMTGTPYERGKALGQQQEQELRDAAETSRGMEDARKASGNDLYTLSNGRIGGRNIGKW